jgi:hypothetical protein
MEYEIALDGIAGDVFVIDSDLSNALVPDTAVSV